MENHTTNMENQTANVNSDYTDESDWESCRMYYFVMFTVVGSCICLIGLICNVISLYTFCRGVVQTATSYQVIWLAVVDSLLLLGWFACIALRYAMKYFHEDWDRRVIFPITFVYIEDVYFTAHTCTMWLTVFIGVYRYLAVCKPHSKQYCHIERHGQKYIVLVLSMAVLYNIPRFCEAYLARGEINGQVKYDSIWTSLGESFQYRLVYWTIMYSVFVVCLPFIILIIIPLDH